LEKCIFAVPTSELLGHMIFLVAGSAPRTKNTAAIYSCPAPQDIKKLQRFLSMVNFYRRFLPGCASVSSPLTDILKGSPKTLQWTAMAKEAFQGAKCLLTKVVPLQHPSPQAKLSLATDASDSHIRGDIQQKAS
jgi:putative transposase